MLLALSERMASEEMMKPKQLASSANLNGTQTNQLSERTEKRRAMKKKRFEKWLKKQIKDGAVHDR